MPAWTSMSHALRRRKGLPSNSLDSVATNMDTRKTLTPEEVINSAEHKNSARKYVGQSQSVSSPSASPLKGTLVSRKNTQSEDPTINDKANRTQTGRLGAQYRVTATMPKGTEPAAGPTMQSARTIPSVLGRQSPNFSRAVSDSQ